MGIFHSKIAPAQIKVSQDLQDPRSPTVNINRSPIGNVETFDKPTITKVRDLTADLTEILDNTQTPVRPEPSSKLQSLLDPRSPGSFDRTPLVLPGGLQNQHDESNASNVGLCGTSLEYEEISCDEATLGEVSAVVSETPSLFSSDISLNAELKADIECIIQGLHHDASGKDPRSPSINIQRTPIVFEEKDTLEEDQLQEATDEKDEKEAQKPSQDKTIPIVILQDENASTPAVTPIKEKLERLTVNSAPRTPLGCVTNVKKTPAAQNMRKTALFGQMKQNNAATTVASAEIVTKKPALQTRTSKIPTLRMK